MMKIDITSNKNVVDVECEMKIKGTRRDAIAEFVGVMNALKKSDKDIFREALHKVIREDINEMIDELDDLEDLDEDDKDEGEHDD